jgi:hypothetical protein
MICELKEWSDEEFFSLICLNREEDRHDRCHDTHESGDESTNNGENREEESEKKAEEHHECLFRMKQGKLRLLEDEHREEKDEVCESRDDPLSR